MGSSLRQRRQSSVAGPGEVVSDIDVLSALQEDSYQWGDLAAIRYDKARTELFPDDYLGHLYNRCRESKRRSGNGILDVTFGGNPASDFNSIITYLAQRPALIIMGKWTDGKFNELGFAFPTVSTGFANTDKSINGGYCFFREAWGTEDQQILTMLGLAYMFKEFNVIAIHGNRYKDNVLTAKFMGRFGFKDVGDIPRFQVRGTKLVSMVLSTLLREDFEEYVKQFLVEQFRAAHSPTIGTVEHPAVEETRETIDAQVARLAAGQIPVVFLPLNSHYLPPVPEGMDLAIEGHGPGAGAYFFNPEMLSAAEIAEAAANGTHGKLLGHVQNKAEIASTEPTVVVQAVDGNGVVLQDSVVSRNAEAVVVQSEALRRKFPDCQIQVRDPLDVIDEREAARAQVESNPLPEKVVAITEAAPPAEDDQPLLPLSWL